jgi:hypothetical protein
MDARSTLFRLLFDPEDRTIPAHRLFEGKSLDANVLMDVLNTWHNQARNDPGPMSFMLMDTRTAWTCIPRFKSRRCIAAIDQARYECGFVPYRALSADADKGALFATWRTRLTPKLFVGDTFCAFDQTAYSMFALNKLIVDDKFDLFENRQATPKGVQSYNGRLLPFLRGCRNLEDLKLLFYGPLLPAFLDFRALEGLRKFRMESSSNARVGPVFIIYLPPHLEDLELDFGAPGWGHRTAVLYPHNLRKLALLGFASLLLSRKTTVLCLPPRLEELSIELGEDDCLSIESVLHVVFTSATNLRRLCITHVMWLCPKIDGNWLPQTLEELVIPRRPFCFSGAPRTNGAYCHICSIHHHAWRD